MSGSTVSGTGMDDTSGRRAIGDVRLTRMRYGFRAAPCTVMDATLIAAGIGDNFTARHRPRHAYNFGFCLRRRSRMEWQDEPDDGPTHRIVLQADPSGVGFDKRLADGQSEAG